MHVCQTMMILPVFQVISFSSLSPVVAVIACLLHYSPVHSGPLYLVMTVKVVVTKGL